MTDTTDEIETDESAEIEEPAPPPGVPITVNGEVFYAAPGRNLIDACEDAGVYVHASAITRA